MLTILIGTIVGVSTGFFFWRDLESPGWGIFCGIVALLITQLIITLILRRRINAEQMKLQMVMQEYRAKSERQVERFQQRQPGNVSGCKDLMERLQREAIKKALEMTKAFDRFNLWNITNSRQTASMRAVFYFQLKDYKRTDELLKKAILFDAQIIAIKLARMFKNNDTELDKFYASKHRRIKGEQLAFLASVYAWIKLKQHSDNLKRENEAPKSVKNSDAKAEAKPATEDCIKMALDALQEAENATGNEVVKENIDRIRNGKYKHFSNHGFGEMWFALGLEELKIKSQRIKQTRPY